MSRDFKLKFDDFKDNHSAEQGDGDKTTNQYPSSGHVRHIVFVWPENRMQSFNYSYLVTQSYDAAKNTIVMEFTSHTVEIKGVRLDVLFHELVMQVPKYIRIMDKRYNNAGNAIGTIVNEVLLAEKQSVTK